MIEVYTRNIDGVWFGTACAEQRVFGTAFANSQKEVLKTLLSSIPFNVPFRVFSEPSAFAETVLSSAKNVYDGKGVSQKLPLATGRLSAYTQRVLEVVSKIPIGYVASYGAVAKSVGGSPRAVGHVMSLNPFAPVVPCHRVVSSDFTLGGYGGGLNVKLEMLIREKRGFVLVREVSVGDEKLQVFPVEFVLNKIDMLSLPVE